MKLALKVDVDTYRGTRRGVPRLVELLKKHGAGATFLFSLGPDHTGRAIKRVFRRGFVGKVSRPVEERQEPVVRQHRGARYLSDEAATEHALDRAARVIRTEAEEESGAGAVLFQQLDEARNSSPRAAVGIDVDFQGKPHSTSRLASATCVR